jgi:hypothetical protein
LNACEEKFGDDAMEARVVLALGWWSLGEWEKGLNELGGSDFDGWEKRWEGEKEGVGSGGYGGAMRVMKVVLQGERLWLYLV